MNELWEFFSYPLLTAALPHGQFFYRNLMTIGSMTIEKVPQIACSLTVLAKYEIPGISIITHYFPSQYILMHLMVLEFPAHPLLWSPGSRCALARFHCCRQDNP